MNTSSTLNIHKLFEKVKKIDNTYDLLTEIYKDNVNTEKDPNIKYFLLTAFFQRKNTQLSLNEIWRLFKVLVAVNDKMIKENKETNELYALSLEHCAKLLFQNISNLNIDKNFGFKNIEINILFDFLFSFPLVKHYINYIGVKEQREGLNNLLNQIGHTIKEKIKISDNEVIKNIFINFYHFLEIKEINSNPKEKAKTKVTDSKVATTPKIKKIITYNKSTDIFSNIYINIATGNKSIPETTANTDIKSIINDENTDASNIQLKASKNNPKSEQMTAPITTKIVENQINKIKSKNNIVKNNEIDTMDEIPKCFPLINKRDVNEEIKIFNKYIKNLVEKVDSYINFEEMKKAIKEKLPGNCLLQIGSFLFNTPFPDFTNINVDLLIQKKTNGTYNIKKYFDTFETFKNISNIKCSFFCLNKDQYFYDCLEKNKSFFHLTRTDMDESTAKSKYNFKTVTVHLYAYNMIYGYSSFFIKKLYSTVKNLWKLHLFYESILLKHFPLLKSNYELSLLILNFLQMNYKIFSEKCEDKQFTYFAYDRSKKYGFLTNYPLVMQYKTLYFLEFDEKCISRIKEISVLELAREFHKFLCKYFEYIYNDGILFETKNEFNLSRENYFLDIKYIFNRHFLDQNLIAYKNNSTDEFIKIKNLFNTLSLE